MSCVLMVLLAMCVVMWTAMDRKRLLESVYYSAAGAVPARPRELRLVGI